VLAGEGLAASPDLAAWWGWHDGADGPVVRDGLGVVERPENTLVGSWHVISLADAVRIRHWCLADYAQLGATDTLPAGWMPVLHFVGTPYLAADTSVPGKGSPLYIVDGAGGLPEHPPRPQFASLAELVSILIGLFDDGIESSYPAARDELGELEVGHLDVKGRDEPIDVRVLRVAGERVEEPIAV
jgi:hypothetical protein